MSAPAVSDRERPAFPTGVRTKFDAVRSMWVLLAPERAIKLDQVGAAVLAEVDGERCFADIAKALAEKYDAPLDRIACDAGAFLRSLADRRMIDLR